MNENARKVQEIAAACGFNVDTRYNTELFTQRVKNGPAKIKGKWLVLSDVDDIDRLPRTPGDPVVLFVYEHCEAENGPAFAGGECGGDGPLSDHVYPNIVHACAAVKQLLNG